LITNIIQAQKCRKTLVVFVTQMGIRIENNFWITKTGNTDLMKNIPITVEEIESYMKKSSVKSKK
jgi:Xaa-Pro aminopeptidase